MLTEAKAPYPFRPVRIEWKDARLEDGWQEKDRFDFRPQPVVSVGILVADTRNEQLGGSVSIALTYGLTPSGEIYLSDVLTIPQLSISRIQRLAKEEEGQAGVAVSSFKGGEQGG